jgi:hypothetical protein
LYSPDPPDRFTVEKIYQVLKIVSNKRGWKKFMSGHEVWRKTIAELGISCPEPGHAPDKVRTLFFDTIHNMTVKGWTDSEINRVFARHIAVWMGHCSDIVPPIAHQEIENLVKVHLKNYVTVDMCKGGCDCAKVARAMIDILNSIEKQAVVTSR